MCIVKRQSLDSLYFDNWAQASKMRIPSKSCHTSPLTSTIFSSGPRLSALVLGRLFFVAPFRCFPSHRNRGNQAAGETIDVIKRTRKVETVLSAQSARRVPGIVRCPFRSSGDRGFTRGRRSVRPEGIFVQDLCSLPHFSSSISSSSHFSVVLVPLRLFLSGKERRTRSRLADESSREGNS